MSFKFSIFRLYSIKEKDYFKIIDIILSQIICIPECFHLYLNQEKGNDIGKLLSESSKEFYLLFEKKINKFWKFLLFIVITTFAIEIIQFLTMRGTADIDDIILNSLGGCIGYGIIQIKPIKRFLKLDE